jgi:hypothetical protein
MRTVSKALWDQFTLATGTTSTAAFRLENLEGASLQLTVASGTLTGTLTLQGSNDMGGPTSATDQYMPGNTAAPTITNWTDITGSGLPWAINLTTGSPFLANLSQLYFRWIRGTFTSTSAGGTTSVVTLIVFGKGPM